MYDGDYHDLSTYTGYDEEEYVEPVPEYNAPHADQAYAGYDPGYDPGYGPGYAPGYEPSYGVVWKEHEDACAAYEKAYAAYQRALECSRALQPLPRCPPASLGSQAPSWHPAQPRPLWSTDARRPPPRPHHRVYQRCPTQRSSGASPPQPPPPPPPPPPALPALPQSFCVEVAVGAQTAAPEQAAPLEAPISAPISALISVPISAPRARSPSPTPSQPPPHAQRHEPSADHYQVAAAAPVTVPTSAIGPPTMPHVPIGMPVLCPNDAPATAASALVGRSDLVADTKLSDAMGVPRDAILIQPDGVNGVEGSGGHGRNLAERLAWSPEEDAAIVAGVRELGCKWRVIASLLVGRSDDAVRNRWNRVKDLPVHNEGRAVLTNPTKPDHKTAAAPVSSAGAGSSHAASSEQVGALRRSNHPR